MNTNEYLWLILVPVAQVWRGKFPDGKAPFKSIRTYSKCRVAFINKKQEKEWQEFCKTHDLKNDPELEY